MLDEPTEEQFSDMLDSVWLKSEPISIHQVTYGIQVLTPVAGAVTWDIDKGGHARLVLTANCTLTFQNFKAGQTVYLDVVQDAVGGRTLTITGGVKTNNNGAGVFTLSAAPNADDSLVFIHCDTYKKCLINKAFS